MRGAAGFISKDIDHHTHGAMMKLLVYIEFYLHVLAVTARFHQLIILNA
jgi:hypothetical protein